MRILANLNVAGTLDIDTVANAGVDTDRFLVQDANGVVKYRTGSEVASDIGATVGFVSTVKHLVKLGENISKGQAVYISSADGTNMIVMKASNDSEAASSKVLGLLETGGVTNDQVYVITEGLLPGLNTSTATAGDEVWLATAGNLIFGNTNKPYAPANLVFLGVVTRVNTNNGEIFVKVQNGSELEELHNVQITTTPSNNQVLTYESSSSLYKMKTIDGSWVTGAALTKVDDTNVTLTLGGSASTSLLRAASLTLGWTGQLAVSRGGTGVSTANANTVFAGPTTGAAAAPAFRALVSADIPNNAANTTGSAATLTTARTLTIGATGRTFDGSTDRTWTLADIGAAAALSGTINTIAYWDSATSIASLATATYPSLTELSYVKGVTSAIQTQLNAKLNLSGGTLTGALNGTSATFSDTLSVVESGNALFRVHASTNTTPVADIELMRGTNATWGADAYGDYRFRSSGGDLIIQYGDSGVTTTFLTIASTGAATFSSSVTASSFIKLGGTAAQILAADGSVVTAGTNITISGGTISAADIGFANPMTTLGDIIYGAASGTATRLAGNTTAVKQYLSQTGTGTVSAAPAWATIAGSDITGAALTKTDDTNVTLTLGGTPATALLRAASLTLGWTGQLSVARGGTGASTAVVAFDNLSPLTTLGDTLYHNGTDNVRLAGNTVNGRRFLRQTGTGTVSAAPVWDSIVAADIPASALTKTDDTNVTLTLGGTPASSLLAAVSLTLGWTGQLAISRGGTGASTKAGAFDALSPMTTLGDITYGGASGTGTRLAGNTTTTKQYLSQTGNGTVSAAPSWSTIAGSDITGAALTETDDTNVTLTLGGTPSTALLRAVSMTLGWTGQLSVARGGTGAASFTAGQILYGNGTSAIASSATLTYGATAALLVNNSVTAASAIARGVNITSTLIAAANNDVLVAVDIAPTYTNGAFTGVTNTALRVQGTTTLTGALTATSAIFSSTITATSGTFSGNLIAGYAGSASEYYLSIGEARNGNGYAYIDLVGDATYTDYGLRIIRGNSGANSTSQIVHRGTGDLQINADEAAPIVFRTSAIERARIVAGGDFVIGNGDTSATPATGVVRGTNATGTNIAGAEFRVAAGIGTGTGVGGAITFYTAAAGTTGSTLNTATEKMSISAAGTVRINGLTTNGLVYTSGANGTLNAAARTINGTTFDGSANITITANTTNAITFNNGGAGAASGTTFNGSAARTISYNTIGAQPLLTNPITGDGTEAAGNISYFTGNTSIAGNASLFWDTTNSRLGVGTNTPNLSLDVRGNTTLGGGATATSLQHTLDASGRYLIVSGSGANPNYGFVWVVNNVAETTGATMGGYAFGQLVTSKTGTNAGTKALISGVTSGSGGTVGGFGGELRFFTRPDNAANDIGTYERMRINSAGAITMYGALTTGGNVNIPNGSYYRANRSTGSATISVLGFASGSDTLTLAGGTSGAATSIKFADTGGDIAGFYNGNFGVGQTNPTSAKLVVVGSAAAASNVTLLNLANSSDGGVKLNFSNSVAAELASITAGVTGTGAGTDDGTLIFRTATNGVAADRLTIDSTGAATFSSSVSTTFISVSSSNGQIGGFNSTNANGGYVTWSTSGTTIADLGTSQQIFGTGGNGTFGINARGARNLVFGANNTERMRVVSDGNVLIGETTSSTSRLVVRKDAAGARGGEISIVNYAASTLNSSAALNFGLEASTYDADNGNAQIKAQITNAGNSASDIIMSTWNGSAFGERFRIASAGAATFQSSVTASSFFEPSDIRLKEIIERNPSVYLDIDLVKYKKKDRDGVRYGYIAQEVKALIPELAEGDDILSLNYQDIHSIKIAALEAKIKQLEEQLKNK